MADFSPIGGAPPRQILQAFQEGARQGDELRVVADGQDFKVLAQGQFTSASGLGRSVAWVQDDKDTTGIFMQAMSQTFGARVSNAVADALGLAPAAGKPLASRLVTQALEMAQLGQQAMTGVDFMTQLDHSAVSGGKAFQRQLAELGLDPRAVGPDTRQWVDEQMKARFDSAVATGESPVSAQTASAWLKSLLDTSRP